MQKNDFQEVVVNTSTGHFGPGGAEPSALHGDPRHAEHARAHRVVEDVAGQVLQLPRLLLLALLYLEDLHQHRQHHLRSCRQGRPHHQGHGDRSPLVRPRHRRHVLVAAHLFHSGNRNRINQCNTKNKDDAKNEDTQHKIEALRLKTLIKL
jgi:hypothetical protein